MKRYKADESFVRTKMVEDTHGEWVKYEDVKELVESFEKLTTNKPKGNQFTDVPGPPWT